MKSRIKNFLKFFRDKYLYKRRKIFFQDLQKVIPSSLSIFSINCFAGRIYQDLNRPYNTPTAGLFFLADDFVKIAKDINVIRKPIIQINFRESKFKDLDKVIHSHGIYPIGKFEDTDIEIHFLHYPTFEEAISKWSRRVSRFNFHSYLIIGFCQNGWSEKYINDFSNLTIDNKVLFCNNFDQNLKRLSGVIPIDEFSKFEDSPDGYKNAHVYYKYLINYLRTHESITHPSN